MESGSGCRSTRRQTGHPTASNANESTEIFPQFQVSMSRTVCLALLICTFPLLSGESDEILASRARHSGADRPAFLPTVKPTLRVVSNDQWCGDGICDIFDETEAWCPEDCSCGDGYCDLAESSTFSCPSDCVSAMEVEADPSLTTLGGSPFINQPIVSIVFGAGERTLQSTVVTAQLIQEEEEEEEEEAAVASVTDTEPTTPVLTGQVEVATSCGLAKFTDLAVRLMGTYTLRFTTEIGGLSLESQSSSFVITRGTVHHIGLSVEPRGFLPARPFRVQPVVTVEDVAGNLLDIGSDASRVITASLNHDQRKAALGPPSNLIRTAFDGIVKFVDLQLPEEALNGSFSLLFSSGEYLLPAHTRVFVVAEEASTLVVLQHTTGGVAIQPFPVQPEVQISDKYGNLCTWYEGEGVVVVADLIPPGDLLASMLGDKSRPAVDGRVFFTDLNIDKDGQGFRIVFRVSSGVADPSQVAEAESIPFNVTYGAAYQLALHPDFVPAGASPGDPLAIQPRVFVQDVVGNTVADAQLPITATLLQKGVPVSEGVLKGSTVRPSCPQPTPGVCDCSINLGCGIAAWPPTGDGLRLDAVGDNYTIVFSSPGLVPVESSPGIEVRYGAVNALEISEQPWGLRLGENIRGKPAVRILDKAGNFIPSDDTPVKVEMSVGGVCCYPPSVEVISTNGIARFTELVIPSVPTTVTGMGGVVTALGPEIRLRFSSIQAPDYVESVVLLAAEAPVLLNITQQPGDAMPGIGLGLVPIVELQDSSYIRAGWFRDQPATITATLCFNVPCVFGTYLDGVGSGQPCFRCTTDVDDTCSLHPNTPPLLRPPQIPGLEGVLAGPMEQVVHDGAAVFSDLVFNPVGTYRFKFSAPGFEIVFSEPFTVFDGPIHHLGVISQPNTSIPLAPFTPQPLIELQDAGNNRATSDFSTVITASLRQLDGPYLGQLLPENPTTMSTQVQVQAGLAWFQGLRISSAGSFRVAFSSEQLPLVAEIESEVVHIPIGPAVRPAVSVLPDACLVGGSCAVMPTIEIHDNFGQVVSSWAGQVHVDILSTSCNFGTGGDGWGSFDFELTNGVSAVSEFGLERPPVSNWTVSCDGNFFLNVSGPGLQWTLSDTFLASLPAQQLAVVVNAPPSLPGTPLRIQPKLQVCDEAGRWVRGAVDRVSVELLKCDPASQDSLSCSPVTEYPLIGTKTVRAVQGVAAFTDLRVDRADFCYRLSFSAPGLIGIHSAPLDVAVGAIVIFFDVIVEPQEAIAGRAFGVQPQVAAMDAGKNRITDLTIQIAATLQLDGARTTLLLGSRSQVDNTGKVTFTDLRIDRAGECNRLVFEGRGKTAYSLSFTVSPGPPDRLTLSRDPSLPTPGWAFQLQPIVSISDAWGNILSPTNCVEDCERLTGTVLATLVPRPNDDIWALQGTLEGQRLISADANAIAAFTDLRVDQAGDYDLNFTSSTSLRFVVSELIVPAAADRASRLKVLVEPYGLRSFSQFKIQPQVAVVDMSGNVIRSANTSITVSLRGGDVPGLILYGSRTQPTVNGIATFNDLQVGDEPAFNVTLRFAGGPMCTSSAGLCMEISTQPFDVAGALAQIVFETPPPAIVTAGRPFEMQPALRLLDASGRLYTWWNDYRDNITVVSVPNVTLSCNSSAPNVTENCVNDTLIDPLAAGELLGDDVTQYWMGLASFTDLRIDRVPSPEFGGPLRRLQFSIVAPSLEVFVLDHCCVTIVHAEPSVLLLVSEPRGARPGLPFSSPPVLQAYDAYGNLADGGPAVTVSATLYKDGSPTVEQDYPSVGDASNDTIAAVVSLRTLGYDRQGSGFTILFSSPGLLSVESQAFLLAAATEPWELVLVVHPEGFGVNDAFRLQPVVETRDRGNNVVTSPGNVTVTLLSDTHGAQLEPPENTTVVLDNGVGQFFGLRISRNGTGMQLEFALMNSTLSVKSKPFEVASNPAQLNVTMQPSIVASFGGEPLSSQPSVELLDRYGFLHSNHTTVEVTASLFQSGGPVPCPAGQSVRCVLSGACASSLDKCPVLEGQVTAEFTNGMAIFTDLRIGGCNDRGEAACFFVNYQLTFTMGSDIVSAMSNMFVVNVGPAAVLEIVQHHVATFPGYVFPTQPELWVLDLGGNVVESYEEIVTVNLEAAQDCLLCAICPCTSTPSWFGERKVQAQLGRVTFAGLGINTAGGAYRLNFTGPGVVTAESDLFDLAVGPGVSLRLVSHDVHTAGGVAFEALVEAIDLGGNRVRSHFGRVGATVAKGGEGQGTLFGSTSVAFVFGLATMSNLQLDKEGSCYVLSFTSDGLEGVDSDPITVSIGPAESVVMLTQPAGFVAGKSFEVAPTVGIVDGGGNIVETANDQLEVWLVDSGGARSSLCSWLLLGAPACVTSVQAAAGMATFEGLHVDLAGTGFTLRFGKNRGGFQEAESDPFDIAVGPAVMLELARAPEVATDARGQPGYPLAVQPWVAVRDAGGNLVFGGGEIVHAELWLDGKEADTLPVALWEQPFRLYNPLLPTQGAIDRSQNREAFDGLSTFTNLQVDRVKQGFSIRFTAPGLLWVESAPFDIVLGAAYTVGVQRLPLGSRSGDPFMFQPVVHMQDRGRNRILASPDFLMIAALEQGPGVLWPDRQQLAPIVGGVAVFTDLAIRGQGLHTIKFSASALETDVTPLFNVSGDAHAIEMTVEPNASTAAVQLTTQPHVRITDDISVTVDADFATQVRAELQSSSNPRRAVLLGNTTVRCCWGQCLFTDLAVSKAGEAYVLSFWSPQLLEALSVPFEVLGPSRINVTVEPQGGMTGQLLAMQPVIRVTDERHTLMVDCNLNSCHMDSAALVTATLKEGTGGLPLAALQGNRTAPVIAGVANFTDLVVVGAGRGFVEFGYILVFSHVELYSDQGMPFDVQYEPGPVVPIVYAKVLLFGIDRAGFAVLQQVAFRRAIGGRVATDELDVILLSAADREQGSARRKLASTLLRVRTLLQESQGLEVAFHVECESDDEALAFRNELEVMLLLEGELARELAGQGLFIDGSLLLEGPLAFAADGSELFETVPTDNTAGIVGAVVGCILAVGCGVACYVGYWRARKRALIRSEDEDDLMWAIGVEYPKDDVDAALPWMAEKMLDKEKTVEKALSLRSISAKS